MREDFKWLPAFKNVSHPREWDPQRSDQLNMLLAPASTYHENLVRIEGGMFFDKVKFLYELLTCNSNKPIHRWMDTPIYDLYECN